MDDVCSDSSFCAGPRQAWQELVSAGPAVILTPVRPLVIPLAGPLDRLVTNLPPGLIEPLTLLGPSVLMTIPAAVAIRPAVFRPLTIATILAARRVVSQRGQRHRRRRREREQCVSELHIRAPIRRPRPGVTHERSSPPR